MAAASDAYFSYIIEQLSQYLSISEELLGSIENTDELDSLLSKRDDIIKVLKSNEKFDINALNSCTQSQKSHINHLTDLILAIDEDIAKLIGKNRKRLIESMKANIREQKIAEYAGFANTAITENKLFQV